MPEGTWYFDFISPFSYLQSRILDRLPGGFRYAMKPVLFGAILAHWGSVGPAELAPKRLGTYRMCRWWARRNGIPFTMPPAHPFPPLKPLRLCQALGNDPDTVHAIFNFIWEEGRNPDDSGEFAALADRLGLADAWAAIDDPAAKEGIRANTGEAIALGVYGVPSFVVNGEVFWGVDATDMLSDYLADPGLFDEPEMARYPDLPVGIERRRG